MGIFCSFGSTIDYIGKRRLAVDRMRGMLEQLGGLVVVELEEQLSEGDKADKREEAQSRP